jgi:hypothetical protein
MFGMISKSFDPNLKDSWLNANPAPRRDRRAFLFSSVLSPSGILLEDLDESLSLRPRKLDPWKDKIPFKCFLL